MYLSMYVFLRQSFALVTQAGVQWRDLGSLQPPPTPHQPQVQAILLPQTLSSWDYTRLPPRMTNVYIFSRDGGFTILARLDKLLTSGDPPISASQSAKITGVSDHAGHTWLIFCVFRKPSSASQSAGITGISRRA